MKRLPLNRELQIWAYRPSFSRLLLLGNKWSKHETRIAVMLQATDRINLPTFFHCDAIEWQEHESDKVFNFLSGADKWSVKACAIFWEEDELDYSDPVPLFDRGFT